MSFKMGAGAVGEGKKIVRDASIRVPPVEGNDSDVMGERGSSKGLNEADDVGDPLFSVEVAKAETSGTTGGIHDGTGSLWIVPTFA